MFAQWEVSLTKLETVHISFTWENILSVPVPINNVFLECKFGDQIIQLPANYDDQLMLKLEHLDMQMLPDVSLDANQKLLISLELTPKSTGELVILGVRYFLCGILKTYRPFEKPIVLMITPPMPILEVAFHQFPEILVAGQVCQCVLEVNNKGTSGLCDLIAKTSHPTFIQFGDSNEPTSPNLPCYG